MHPGVPTPVSFGESASYVCCGTVLVVGQSLYDDRDTIRAITFVGDTLVVVCVCISGSFLIPRSMVSFGMLFAFALR